MPLATAPWGLVYPAPGDFPCDFDTTWCEFSDTFQTALDGFNSIIDRTEPVIPLAQLIRTTPLEMSSGVSIPFDAIGSDTAGWTDFDADPTTITTDRGGYLGISANATVNTSGATPVTFELSITGTAFGMIDSRIDQGAAGTVMGMQISGLILRTSPAPFGLTITRTAATPVSLLQAQLTVFWHSDRAAP